MKKVILFTLCFITFVNFGNNVFASSSNKYAGNKAYHGALGCFDYLVKTRNFDRNDKKAIQERERRESALINAFNEPNTIGRDVIMTAYIQRTEMYREKSSNERRNGNSKNENFYTDCLNEMSRIARVIGLK